MTESSAWPYSKLKFSWPFHENELTTTQNKKGDAIAEQSKALLLWQKTNEKLRSQICPHTEAIKKQIKVE